jgi:hypothetical protein
VPVDDLVEVAEEMGEELGERMGDAIKDSQWVHCCGFNRGAVLHHCGWQRGGHRSGGHGSRAGWQRGILTGLDGQRYTLPGSKIGEITISRVSPRQSFGAPESGEMPPVGSILIPGPVIT